MTASWDRDRFRNGLQSLEDHCHTLLEAHAEAPQQYLETVQVSALALERCRLRVEAEDELSSQDELGETPK